MTGMATDVEFHEMVTHWGKMLVWLSWVQLSGEEKIQKMEMERGRELGWAGEWVGG